MNTPIDNSGRPRGPIGVTTTTSIEVTVTAEVQSAKGNLGGVAAAGPTPIVGGMNLGTSFSDLLSAPKKVQPSAVQFSVAINVADSQNTLFSMVDVTRLLAQATKQSRKLLRDDMLNSMDQQAKLTEGMVGKMRDAAQVRFTTTMISSAVAIVGAVGQMKYSGNQALGMGVGQFGQGLSGAINAVGEFKASNLDADVKLAEATINRVEKNYQESNQMLGDMRDNLQAARDTLRALIQAQGMNDIVRNF